MTDDEASLMRQFGVVLESIQSKSSPYPKHMSWLNG